MKRSTKGRRPADPDNPPLTAKQLARFRPSIEVVPHIVAAYRARRGRPPNGEASKVQVTLRLDPRIIAHFKRKGPGWQTRINDALAAAISRKTSGR
jgi:uncharacterized protein (DUF4415 family)